MKLFLSLDFCNLEVRYVEKVNAKSGQQVKLYVPLDYRTFNPLCINDSKAYFFYVFQTIKRSFFIYD